MESSSSDRSFGWTAAAALVLLGLKLLGADIPWIWVASPLWIPPVLTVFIVISVYTLAKLGIIKLPA